MDLFGCFQHTAALRHPAQGGGLFWQPGPGRRYGSLLVEPAQITFKAGDASKVYDGEALTCGEIEAVSGALLEGHTVKNFEVSGSQKSVGRSESVITHVAIHDENGKNVTKNYAILLLPGRLTVTMK